jgi:hypothetical protein
VLERAILQYEVSRVAALAWERQSLGVGLAQGGFPEPIGKAANLPRFKAGQEVGGEFVCGRRGERRVIGFEIIALHELVSKC